MNQTIQKMLGLTALCIGVACAMFIVGRLHQCENCGGYYNGVTKGKCPHCGYLNLKFISTRE